MGIRVACPACDEEDDLEGRPEGGLIALACGSCGMTWRRDPAPRCAGCGGGELREAVAAIVEKGRGTQLSVVGTRVVHLCTVCDAEALARYLANRPNPLMPDRLPTVGDQD